jgi:hypothetical protein
MTNPDFSRALPHRAKAFPEEQRIRGFVGYGVGME